jgi:hypothetical protein
MDPALIISLLSGAAGGNAAGSIFKNLGQGLLVNSISGILGGGILGKLAGPVIASALGAKTGGLDVMSILSSVLTGGVGGGGMLAIIGMIKSMMGK